MSDFEYAYNKGMLCNKEVIVGYKHNIMMKEKYFFLLKGRKYKKDI